MSFFLLLFLRPLPAEAEQDATSVYEAEAPEVTLYGMVSQKKLSEKQKAAKQKGK